TRTPATPTPSSPACAGTRSATPRARARAGIPRCRTPTASRSGIRPGTEPSSGLHLQERVVVSGVLHLQRRVLDLVAVAQQELELTPDAIAVVSPLHDDESGECVESRRHRPHVELMDAADATDGAHRLR